MATVIDEAALDERLARLEAVRPWSPRVVSRLEALIRSDDEAELFRVNPFAFAGQRGLAEDEAIDLFLHATALGMFEMDWLLICPMCACAVESFAHLRAVLRRYQCPMCRHEYEAAMDDLIAVYFNVSPTIRSIRFHRPETLEAYEYLFLFKGVREGRTPNGELFIEAAKLSMRWISFMTAGETVAVQLEAEEGMLAGGGTHAGPYFILTVGSETASEPQRLRLTYDGTSYEPKETALRRGPVVLEVTNASRDRSVLAIFYSPPGYEEVPLDFEPYLTGKRLITTQTFKGLFRSEVVGGTEGLTIRDVALLFTDIKGSTALYQRIGDLNAFQLVQQHFDQLREATVRHGGAVVKTIGDAVMAAYPDAARAVAAALDMRDTIEQYNRDQPERPMSIKIGIHHGAAIAVTLNNELDYFGQTVNIASRVQEMADAAEIWITDEVWRYPGVQGLLERSSVEARETRFQGIETPMAVRRIGLPEAA
jgi:class 3 adenylate cyclase